MDIESPQIRGQTTVYDYIDTPPENVEEQNMTPQETGGALPPETCSRVVGSWVPDGYTVIEQERVLQAIEGMTITSVSRDEDETILHLQGAECPAINLTITDDGYWVATVQA